MKKVMMVLLVISMVGPLWAAEKRGKLFNVKSGDISNEGVEVIRPWKTILLDKDYRGAWLVAGDLTGDGQPEIVSVRSLAEDGDNHSTASAVVHRLDGSVLWKWGNPEGKRENLWSDVACQIYDWDGDGKNEVIVSVVQDNKTWLVELEGSTGKEKRRFEIPDNSADCIVFCNLSGGERAREVLVKTRYSQIWAYSYEGKQLWTIEKPGGYMTAHQPRPMDIDGDGKDELMAGYSLLNADGTVRWTMESGDGSRFGGHLDCGRAFQMGKNPEEARIIMTFCGGNRITCADGKGKAIWSIAGKGLHYESVDIGKVCAGERGEQLVVDIPYAKWGECPIQVISGDGVILGEILTEYSRFHRLIDWTGDAVEEIIIGQDHCMFDGQGKKTGIFDMPVPEGVKAPSATEESIICAVGDMSGDGVADIIYYTNPGTVVYIYKNTKGKPSRKVPLGMGVNFTLY